MRQVGPHPPRSPCGPALPLAKNLRSFSTVREFFGAKLRITTKRLDNASARVERAPLIKLAARDTSG